MNKKGFTLIELLAVVCIIGILTSIALPQYRKVVEKADFTQAQVMAKSLFDSCERTVSEWGADSWAEIPDSTENPKYDRLDIGDNSVLPAGFKWNAEKKIVGKGFVFELNGEGTERNGCNVSITKSQAPYINVLVKYNGTDFYYCGGDEDACNIYALDYESAE